MYALRLRFFEKYCLIYVDDNNVHFEWLFFCSYSCVEYLGEATMSTHIIAIFLYTYGTMNTTMARVLSADKRPMHTKDRNSKLGGGHQRRFPLCCMHCVAYRLRGVRAREI